MDRAIGFFERARLWSARHSSHLLAAGLLLLLLQDIFGTHGLLAMRRSQKELEQTRQEIERLETENKQLEEHMKALKTDPRAIEQIARDEMGLARPGELIFTLPPKPGDASSVNPSAQPGDK